MPQYWLLKTSSLPTLTDSSRQENSVRDTTSVGPALGTTYRRNRTLLFFGLSFLLSYVFLLLFHLELSLSLFRFLSFFLAIRYSTTPFPLRLCVHHHTFGHNPLHYLPPFFFTLMRSILVFNLFAWPRTRNAFEELSLCNRPLSFPFPFVFRRLKSFVAPVTTAFRAFSFSWERGLPPPSFSPRAFALPSGSRTRLRSQNYPRTPKRGLTTRATIH